MFSIRVRFSRVLEKISSIYLSILSIYILSIYLLYISTLYYWRGMYKQMNKQRPSEQLLVEFVRLRVGCSRFALMEVLT